MAVTPLAERAARAAAERDADPEAAVRELVRVVGEEPSLWLQVGDDRWLELADELGPDVAVPLRWAQLRACLEEPERYGDDLRELYAELLERAAGRAELDEIRTLGRRLDELAAAGIIPRTFVRRGPTRS